MIVVGLTSARRPASIARRRARSASPRLRLGRRAHLKLNTGWSDGKALAFAREQLRHHGVTLGENHILHLHRLDDDQPLAGL
jgi:hypothetical protein